MQQKLATLTLTFEAGTYTVELMGHRAAIRHHIRGLAYKSTFTPTSDMTIDAIQRAMRQTIEHCTLPLEDQASTMGYQLALSLLPEAEDM